MPDRGVNQAGLVRQDAKRSRERDARKSVRRADDDQVYVVSLADRGDRVHTHGDTYDEALQRGRELPDLLIQSRRAW